MIPGQLFEAFVNTFAPAAGVTAFMYALLRWTPGLNAATRYASWWITLIAILLLPIAYLGRPAGDRPALAESVAIEPVRPLLMAEIAPVDVEPIRVDGNQAVPPLFTIWAIGSLLLLARLAASYTGLRALKRRSVCLPAVSTNAAARPVRILESKEVASPVAVGFLHPAIIVPQGLASKLAAAELDAVLAHERAHLERRDDWANLLGRLVAAILWFHPLAWFILRRLDIERELACDACAVNRTGDARAYAALLVKLSEWRQNMTAAREPQLAAGMLGRRPSQLAHRIQELLRARLVPGISHTRLAAAGFAILLLSAGALRLPALVTLDPPPHPPHPVEAPQAPVPPNPVPAPQKKPMPAPSTAPKPWAGLQPTPVAPPDPPTPPKVADKPGYLAGLKAAGYTDLNVDQIIELKVHGVSPGYIGEMTSILGKLTHRQLVDLKIHGVRPGHARQAKQFKSNVSVEQIIRMKNSGIFD